MQFLEWKGIVMHLNKIPEPVLADGPQEKNPTQ